MRFLLSPSLSDPKYFSLLVLGLRLLFGILLMTHGIDKLSHYSELSATFPDPLGIGSQWSLRLAIFGEVVCSVAFIVGFLFRLSVIPMIITMLTAFAQVHHGRIAEGELAFVYLAVFILLFVSGPGRYAVDSLLFRVNKDKAFNL